MNAMQRAAKAAVKRASTVLAPHQAVIVLVLDGTANGGIGVATNRENLSAAMLATVLRTTAAELSPDAAPELDDAGADVVPIRRPS